MIKKTNTTLIGAFVFGAMVATVAAMVYLGAMKWASQEETFVFFFAESVTGLEVGAKVKFQGVDVGAVKAIRIAHMHLNEDDEWERNQIQDVTVYDDSGDMAMRPINLIPVYATIDLAEVRRLGVMGEESNLGDLSFLSSLVHDEGLRAQLQLDSIITGVKFIEINFFSEEELTTKYEKDTRGPVYGQIHGDFAEIPTIPSLSKSAEELFRNLSKVDLEAINDNFQETLGAIQGAAEVLEAQIRDADIAGAVHSVSEAAEAVNGLIGSLELEQTVEQANLTLEEARTLVATMSARMDELMAETGPVYAALDSIEGAATRIDEALAPEASLRYHTEKALSNLAETARSLKEFVDFLERNPRALITGRSPTPKE